jgi:cytochrome c oxidase subunit 3
MSTAHEGSDHPAFLQHHFHTVQQQEASAKLGMWLFLVQELLFFAGIFLAYGTLRYFYPDTMLQAHEQLSIPLGGLNTLVLITSSSRWRSVCGRPSSATTGTCDSSWP